LSFFSGYWVFGVNQSWGDYPGDFGHRDLALAGSVVYCKYYQDCGAGVGGFGWGRIPYNTGSRSRIFCPTPDVQLDHFYITLKLGIPVKMVQFLLKFLLKKGFLAVHHDFHWFWQPNFIPFILRSRSRKIWKVGVGNFEKVGYFTSNSTTLNITILFSTGGTVTAGCLENSKHNLPPPACRVNTFISRDSLKCFSLIHEKSDRLMLLTDC